jgi:membrane peptidoglycan carboxypeptidase
VNLPAEEGGWLQPVRDWSGRSQPTLAFGHEIAVTPLQLVMAAAAVANGGLLMRPRLVRAWRDAQGRIAREEPVREVRRVISDSTAATLRAMLRAVVDRGTASDIKHPYIPIAGKTGTAEKIDAATGKYVPGLFNSSFVGMAPADQPAFVCLVLLDEPEQLKFGGQSAAPIFAEILDRLAVEWNWVPARPEVWAAKPAPVTPPALTPVRAPTESMAAAAAPPLLASAGHAPDSLRRETQGADPVMPDVRKASLRDALWKLQGMGIDVDYDGEGRVVSQDPAPGTPLRKGTRCRLTLGWTG